MGPRGPWPRVTMAKFLLGNAFVDGAKDIGRLLPRTTLVLNRVGPGTCGSALGLYLRLHSYAAALLEGKHYGNLLPLFQIVL